MTRRDLWVGMAGLVLGFSALSGCGGFAPTPALESSAPSVSSDRVRTAGNGGYWLQSFYDSQHTGYNATEKKLKRGNVRKLKSAWSALTGAVLDGAMVTDGSLVYVDGNPNSTGYLYAFDVSTGAQKWKFQTYNTTGFTPAISGSLIYDNCLVGGSSAQDGICAINRSTGKLKWSYYDNCSCLPPSEVIQTAAVSGSTLVFGYGPGGCDCDRLVALDTTTGAVLWEVAPGSGGPNSFAYGVPAIDAGTVFVGTDRGVCAYQLASGNLNWCDGGSGGLTLSVTAANGVVYASYTTFGSGGDVIYAENESNGSPMWTYSACDGCAAGYNDPPAIANGTLYAAGNGSGYLYALDAATGALKWSTTTGSVKTVSAPSIANGVVYVSCGSANICAYNSSTGALLGSIGSPSQPYRGSPAISSGRVYSICGGANYLCMYDL